MRGVVVDSGVGGGDGEMVESSGGEREGSGRRKMQSKF